MGLACVDGVGVGAGVWARRGPKSRSAGRVSRRLFATASDPGRNIQFARQELSSAASADAATWNFDFQTMTPLSGPLTWTCTAAAPYSYLPHHHHPATHTHTQLPDATHTQTQLPDAATHTQTQLSEVPTQLPDATTHTQLPDAIHTQLPDATHIQLPDAAIHTQLPDATTHTQLPDATTHTQNTDSESQVNDGTHTEPPSAATTASDDLSTSTSSHTTCLTTAPRCPSPTPTASPSGKPVKRLQQRPAPAKVQTRRITDYFTEVRTPRVKVQLKTELLDSTASPLATRGADLRREEADTN